MNSSQDRRAVCWSNVTFSYSENPKRNTLENVDISVSAEKFTVITGPSGCGKSSLLYLGAGLYPANGGFLRGGNVTVDGATPASLKPEDRARLLCMMFQNPDLQFCMDTVEYELIFCMENISLPVEEMDSRLLEALEFCEISHLRHRLISTLSGGEKQRVMLACAMVIKPKWLLLDEPFANIDEESAATLISKLKKLHEDFGTGILAVDHNPWLWRNAADELIVLSTDGSLLERNIDLKNSSPEKLSELGVSCPALPYQAEKPPKKEFGKTALKISGLSLKKGENEILRGLNAEFEAGKIHAILGKSGCGKSTLFGALCGIEKYRGRILIGGKELKSIKKKELGGTMGFVFQNPQDQFVADSVLDEISVSLKTSKDKNESREAKAILEEIGLWRHRNLSPYMLSQGQQRRLGTAALLCYKCGILICDEPTYAQDRKNVLAIMDELQRRVVNDGLTLIFSTHDSLLAESYADKIYYMREGQLFEKD